ncbi:MAG: hypothetical protein M5R41_11570 [Bacteroidia bacterium]|nr:hypothetical protein [Bacteroidia bacterium]
MKSFTISVVLCLFFVASAAWAQSAERPEPKFMAINFNKVKMTDMSALQKIWFEQAVPILNDLVREGKLVSYGLMEHAWGDEWNFNFFFVTKDHKAHLDFFDMYIERLRKKYPDTMGEYLSKIIEHKDNMYTLYQ